MITCLRQLQAVPHTTLMMHATQPVLLMNSQSECTIEEQEVKSAEGITWNAKIIDYAFKLTSEQFFLYNNYLKDILRKARLFG